jgi:hypothetical protein
MIARLIIPLFLFCSGFVHGEQNLRLGHLGRRAPVEFPPDTSEIHSESITLAATPSLQALPDIVISIGESKFPCKSGVDCFRLNITCPYGSFASDWSDCYTDIHFTASAGWKVTPALKQLAGESVQYLRWGSIAAPESSQTKGPFTIQAANLAQDNCNPYDNEFYERFYCFSSQCQILLKYSYVWSCGMTWISKGYTPCNRDCQRNNIPICVFDATPSKIVVPDSYCETAYGNFLSQFDCKNGFPCGDDQVGYNWGYCDNRDVNKCLIQTKYPTASPTTAIPSVNPTTFPTRKPSSEPTALPTVKPSTSRPTIFPASPYMCKSVTGGQRVNKANQWNPFCDQNKCLPGLEYIGRGFFITRAEMKLELSYEFNAIGPPVFDFQPPYTTMQFNGQTVYRPNGNQILVGTESDTSINTQVYIYQEEIDYSKVMSAQLGWKPDQNQLLKGIGINAGVKKQVDSAIQCESVMIDGYAKTSSLNLKLQPSSSTSQLICSSSISDLLKTLQFSTNPADFDRLISFYGTHIIISARIGGVLHYFLKEKSVKFNKKQSTDESIKASLNLYKSSLTDIILGNRKSVRYMNNKITRTENVHVCGGNPDVFLKDIKRSSSSKSSSSNWELYRQTIYNNASNYCGFDFTVISMTELGRNMRMKLMIEEAIDRYLANSISIANATHSSSSSSLNVGPTNVMNSTDLDELAALNRVTNSSTLLSKKANSDASDLACPSSAHHRMETTMMMMTMITGVIVLLLNVFS